MAYLVHHLLEESAAQYPDQEALRYKGQGMTYAELDAATNRLARTLRQAGVQRGDRVGIYVYKSPASLLAIFGILKAGGVYVPLDPNAPAARLAYITRNCNIQVLVTANEKLPDLAKLAAEDTPLGYAVMTDSGAREPDGLPEGFEVIGWDEVCSQDDSAVPPVGVIETDLAYILYTSGSTGDPKGVMIAHRTIFTFINWGHDTFKIGPSDRVTSHAPIHFDLSTFDIFVTIKGGGTIILVPDTLSVFPIQLVRLLQEERVTVIYMVPSILSMMVDYGKLAAHDLSALRLVLFAGEVFPIKYLRKFVGMVPRPDYYNLYGPTETNVCTYYQVRPEDLDEDRTQPVPIGIACENMEVFAVREDGQLVTGPGEEGELWARGSCVAQGYWGDPERTARGFVPNAHNPHYHEMAYRTGDIVTMREDGNWRYVGRRDHMIKSRGYRIELGEIETALYSCAGVGEAAVVAIPDDLVGNRLRAFVVPANGAALDTAEVEKHCRQHLPKYMMPESVEFLDVLPKTSTGKVNRPALVARIVNGS